MAIAARYPRLWRFVRAGMRRRFDAMAERWEAIAGEMDSPHFAPACAALEALPAGFAPRRIVDVGTGTGQLALGLAARFPGARVLGLDLSPAMIARAEARRRAGLGPDADGAAPRVRFAVADAARLPVPSGSVDLLVLCNTVLFFDELARVLAPGGHALVAFSHGPRTPLYLPLQEVRQAMAARGCTPVAAGQAGDGEFLLLRRPAGD